MVNNFLTIIIVLTIENIIEYKNINKNNNKNII